MKTHPLICLLIDDDQEDHEIFQLALEQTSLPVECIMMNNADEALNLLSEKRMKPDFIFIDVHMPKTGAKECITQIKKINELNETTLIAISTFAMKKQIEELKELGASRFITKPSNIEHLEEILFDCFSAKLPFLN